MAENQDSRGALAVSQLQPKRDVIASVPAHLRASAMEAAGQPWGAPTRASRDVIDLAGRFAAPVRAALAGATDAQRLAILFPLVDLTVKPDALASGQPGEQAIFWKLYHTALAHVPVRVLDGAVKAFISQAPAKDENGRPFPKRFPDPGVLLDLCRENYAWRDAVQLQKGLDRLAASKRGQDRPPSTPEEDAAAMALFRQKMDGLAAKIEAEKAEMAEIDNGRSDEIRETGSLIRRRA